MLAPLHLTFDIGRDRPRKHAVVDIVTAAAAVSEVIAPEGRRRRAIRPWALLGSWLRSSLDRTYDVIHSSIRDHLLEEGSIRVVPLPELENADLDGLEGLSERLLHRLRARWAGMTCPACHCTQRLSYRRSTERSCPPPESRCWSGCVCSAPHGRRTSSHGHHGPSRASPLIPTRWVGPILGWMGSSLKVDPRASTSDHNRCMRCPEVELGPQLD